MSEDEQRTSGVELLLQEPEVVAWLSDYVRADEQDDDGGDEVPPQAA
ncbi:MAG: hypothetical protein ABUS54_04590 [Actinomycetota bacterium]